MKTAKILLVLVALMGVVLLGKGITGNVIGTGVANPSYFGEIAVGLALFLMAVFAQISFRK